VPSATPEPPTAVPPTDTPAATESPKLTAEERATLVEMGKHIGNIGQALGKIGELAQNPTGTDDWKFQMAAASALVRVEHQTLSKMQGPEQLQRPEAAVVRATTDCDAAMVKLASGIDNSSAQDFHDAAVLMQSCNQKIQDARPEMDALQAQT